MYLQLLHYSQKDSLPVSLLHIELTGATSGATKIDESEIPLSLHSLSPTRGGGVSKTFFPENLPHPQPLPPILRLVHINPPLHQHSTWHR